MERTHHHPYDLTTKELFQDLDKSLVKFLLNKEVSTTHHLNFQFPTIENHEADLLFETHVDGERVIFHVEFQSNNDASMVYRMLRYAGEIHKLHQCTLYQVVLYTGAQRLNMSNQLAFQLANHSKLAYQYHLLDLGQISPEQILALEEPSFLPFLPLCQVSTEDKESALKSMVQSILTGLKDLDPLRKKALLLKSEILSGLKYKKEVIELIFREAEEMLMLEESSGYQRIYDKGLEKGLKQGLDEGRQKGLEQGLEKYRHRILETLRRRFQTIPKTLIQRIQREADLEVLDIWLAQAIESESLADFKKRLG